MSNPNLEAAIVYTVCGVAGMATGIVPVMIISGIVTWFGISMFF